MSTQPGPPSVGTVFDLFLSYARRDSRVRVAGKHLDAVAELKRTLEGHFHPQEDDKRFRVFTDVEDFELSDSILKAMREKLGASRTLVVVCSKGAAESPHVQAEIALWAAMLGKPPPLAAVLGASPHEVSNALFSEDTFAADLAPAPGATVREWKRQIERESHKIVARAWGLPLSKVHDRFAARQRKIRKQIAGALTAGVLAAALLAILTAGQTGYHAVADLPAGPRTVSPAGVGFLAGQTPGVVDDSLLLTWEAGNDNQPVVRQIGGPWLRAAFLPDGRVVAVGVEHASIVDGATGEPWELLRVDEGQVLTGLAATADRVAISTKDGALYTGPIAGPLRPALRPVVTRGLRFPVDFQETGPLRYGPDLAWSADGTWIASASPDGHLSILAPETGRFVVAGTPQYPVLDVDKWTPGPVLYQTENTRPIGVIYILPDNEWALFSVGTVGLFRVRLSDGTVEPIETCDLPLLRDLAAHPNGSLMVGSAGSTSTLEVLELKRLESGGAITLGCLQSISVSPHNSPRASFSADGEQLIVGYFDSPPQIFRRTFRVFGVDLPALPH